VFAAVIIVIRRNVINIRVIIVGKSNLQIEFIFLGVFYTALNTQQPGIGRVSADSSMGKAPAFKNTVGLPS